jgi:CRP-like cAMP-binding protein
MSFSYLYRANEDPREIYILQSGELFVYITNHDKYKLTGKNLIIGSLEVILSQFLNIPSTRLETAVFSTNSQIKQLPKEKFLEEFNKYNYLLNVSRVFAKKITLTNEIIKANQTRLTSDFVSLKNICCKYFCIVNTLKEEYTKRKLPWLKDFIAPFLTSLTYVKGESFSKAETPVRILPSDALADKIVDMSRGDLLFKEGEPGTEMYILNSGTINVMVNNNKVASLSEQGTPIGEIALLLGEKRSATLEASSDVRLTKITREDLEFIAQSDIQTFYSIVYSLAKKYYNNLHKIKETNDAVVSKEIDNEEEVVARNRERDKAMAELDKLMKDTGDMIYEKKADYLHDSLKKYGI